MGFFFAHHQQTIFFLRFLSPSSCFPTTSSRRNHFASCATLLNPTAAAAFPSPPTGVPLVKRTPIPSLWCFTVLLVDFVHTWIIHARRLQLLLVNCASALLWPLSGGGGGLLCARSVTVICVVVSAVSMLDLSEQFTPPETAPLALVSLIQAIEKRGTSLSPVSAFPRCTSGPHLPTICLSLSRQRWKV